jgi:chaperonin GroES
VHKGTRKILRIVSRYDERSFEFKDNGDFTKIKATSYFTDYHFIPDPNGNYYSLGFGILLLPTNETVNSLLNQLLDAGTLANRQCGFIGSEFRLPSGDYTVKPGEWKKIQSTPGQVISANIVPLPIKEPSQTLFALMQFLIESSKQITNITDIMAGQLPPPNMPATSTMAMLEQSQQIYNGILYRVHDSLKKEFQKLYDLNRKYLKDEEGFLFAQQFNQVTIQDYESEDYGIYPVADPKLASQMQRLMQAQAMLDLAQFPQINKLEVLTNYLQVLKIAEPKQYLILNPPPPPEVALTNAKTKYTDMQTLSLLMDKELKAIHLNIMEMKEKAKTMYYGGKLATDKVAATVALAQLNQIETPEQVEKAVSEEEAITQGTQMQDQSPEVLQHLDALQKMVDQMMGQAQSTTAPQQMPGLPPEGKIPQLSQEISPAEQLQGTV